MSQHSQPAQLEVTASVELTDAQYIALAESDRDAAIKLMWPDEADAEAMRFLDEIIFDGYIESLKIKVQVEAEALEQSREHTNSNLTLHHFK